MPSTNRIYRELGTCVGTISSHYPVVPRYIVLFWLCYFVTVNSDKLQSYSLPMPKFLLEPARVKSFIDVLKLVEKEYGSDIPAEQFDSIYIPTFKAMVPEK